MQTGWKKEGKKMSKVAYRSEGPDLEVVPDIASVRADPKRIDITPHAGGGGDVLSRDDFLTQLHREKRRADRSQAPLSLVVMRFTSDGEFDYDDQRDVLNDLSFSMRETDVIGYLGDGLVAFLLPYSGVKAAEAFSKQIITRVGLPAANVQFATYSDPEFDRILVEALAHIGPTRESTRSRLRRSVSSRGVKRAMDILGAIILLIIASPLMIIAALAVKLTSPGPVIFRQMRIGRDGMPFPFYKFRSMRCDNDDTVHREYVKNLIQGRLDEINEGDADDPVYKMRSDSRITAVGRFIRRASIDELPQLFNVLKGQMSLVGPRPPIPYEIENYKPWHMRRLQEVRPGITGLWQVDGRSKTSFDEMVRLDLRYIRNWTLWLDIKILLKTIVVVVRCDGAD
ncbi:MAG: exopolysaccharide biosynthesis polyprenyl glycosylphosphotransferase [Woeseiaceae bacterium]